MHLNYAPNSIPKTLRKVLGIFLVVAVTVQVSGMYSFANLLKPVLAADKYLMYAVEDSGGSDTQFFTLKPDIGTAKALGSVYAQYDIEGIDVHPSSGVLYAIAGGGGTQDGKLFQVDRANGTLMQVGDTGAKDGKEIVSASFRNDGTLWAFQESVGIVEVNLAGGALTLKAAAGANGVQDDWEGLAWDVGGQKLYGAQGRKLYVWDPDTETAEKLCENLPNPTEALDFRPDGKLFGGWHNADDEALSIFEIDPSSCTITPTNYDISYRDVESIAFVIEEPAQECAMEIEKTGTPGEVAPGENVAYTVRIKNIGDANCTGGGVELKEFYDTHTSFVSATPNPLQGNNLWNFDVVEPGEEHIVAIVVKASESAQDNATLINKACTWAEQNGPKDDEDNWVCATTTTKVKVPPPGGECELTLEKIAAQEEVAPGDDIDYTVRLKNTGDANCTGGGVELKEFYDTQTTFVSANPNPLQGNNLWNFDTVEPNEEHVIHIKVKASESADDGDELVNKACAWAEQYGPKSQDANWVCDEVTTKVKLPPPSGECRLTVEKSDNPDPVMPGAELTYTVKLKNTGDIDCTGGGVELKEFYDAKTMFKSAQPTPATGNTLWNFGTVEPGEEHTVVIKTEVGTSAQNGDILTNKACAWAEQFGSKLDDDNWVCDTETTTVVKLPPSTARLEITKKVTDTNEALVDANTASMEEQMTYAVELKNTGNAAAMEVVLTDNYDESKVTVTDTDGGGDVDGKITYPIGVINPGQSVTKEIVVKVKSGFTQNFSFDNIAEATALDHPKVSDTVMTTVTVPSPTRFDLKLEKGVSPATIEINQQATFTLTVTNEGTIDGAAITVKDVMPSALTYMSDSTDGDFDKDTGVWTIGELLAGASTNTSITVRATALGTFENIAEIITDGGQDDIDSTPNNQIATEDDQDSAALTVRETPPPGCTSNCGGGGGSPPAPIIRIVKTVNKPVAAPGDIVTYTFTVSAGGTEDSQNVQVTDTLPAGFTFVEGANSARTWNFGTMDEQTSKTESYDVHIGSSVAAGNYENIVVATIINGTAPTNRSEARAKVEVRTGGGGGGGGTPGIPQLTIQKDATVAFTNPSSEVIYNVTVKNIGTVTAKNVTVTDTLPAGFTFAEGGGSTKVITVGDLAAGESRLTVYTVAVGSSVPAGFHKNTATARADNASPVSDDAEVEVRMVQVQGFTTLPDTGTGSMSPLAFAFVSSLMLSFGALLAYRYRNTLKEVARERVVVDFLRS